MKELQRFEKIRRHLQTELWVGLYATTSEHVDASNLNGNEKLLDSASIIALGSKSHTMRDGAEKSMAIEITGLQEESRLDS